MPLVFDNLRSLEYKAPVNPFTTYTYCICQSLILVIICPAPNPAMAPLIAICWVLHAAWLLACRWVLCAGARPQGRAPLGNARRLCARSKTAGPAAGPRWARACVMPSAMDQSRSGIAGSAGPGDAHHRPHCRGGAPHPPFPWQFPRPLTRGSASARGNVDPA